MYWGYLCTHTVLWSFDQVSTVKFRQYHQNRCCVSWRNQKKESQPICCTVFWLNFFLIIVVSLYSEFQNHTISSEHQLGSWIKRKNLSQYTTNICNKSTVFYCIFLPWLQFFQCTEFRISRKKYHQNKCFVSWRNQKKESNPIYCKYMQ